MLDGLFDLFASILTGFYALWPSYGVMIILLTLSVRIVLTPLTVRSTKSMLELRRVQPELKKLQAQYKGDRQRLNEEMQAFYREHKINPLGGCLPILAQAPIFLIMYQVLRGLNRRTSEIGKWISNATAQTWNCRTQPEVDAPVLPGNCSAVDQSAEFVDRTFNPSYLDQGSQLFKSLNNATEMNWLGIDLSFSPSAALAESFVKFLPYLLMIVVVGVLGFYQQRQIAGRNPDAEINPMQRTLMRILPIILPIISFSLPAGLIVYFIATSGIGVAQQAYITHRVYNPWNKEEAVRKGKETEEPEVESDTSSGAQQKTVQKQDEKPKGLMENLFGPKTEDISTHGRKRPSSLPPPKPKATPPAAKRVQPPQSSRSISENQKPAKDAKKTDSKQKETPKASRPTSKRVTPSKKQLEAEAAAKRKKRRK